MVGNLELDMVYSMISRLFVVSVVLDVPVCTVLMAQLRKKKEAILLDSRCPEIKLVVLFLEVIWLLIFPDLITFYRSCIPECCFEIHFILRWALSRNVLSLIIFS